MGTLWQSGAKVELWCNGKYQFTELSLTRGYASSVDPVIHFGLSDNSFVDSIKVTWPSGRNSSVLKKIGVNNTVIMDETDSVSQENIQWRNPNQDHMFYPIADILAYVHEQTDFVDFYLNQKIIPHKFSQIGPSMFKGDINNDGREDVIIGASNKLPTMVFIRTGKGFRKSDFKGLTEIKEFSESGIAVFDIDLDGDNDVITVAGGYETRRESEMQQDLYIIGSSRPEILKDSAFHHYLYRNTNGSFYQGNPSDSALSCLNSFTMRF